MAVSFGNLTGSAKKSNIKYMKLAEGDNTFRILPESVLPGYTYWVKGANGKEIPFEALQFIREKEEFDNSQSCPISDRKLKDDKGENLKCKWSYKCRVINKATGEIEVLQLKKGMLTDIISVAQQLQVDPTHLETGMWLTVNKKKTGPLAYNVEYNLKQLLCKSTPLEPEFVAKLEGLQSMDEMFPRETYEQQSTRLAKHLLGDVDNEDSPSDASSKEAIDELDQ